MGGFPLVNGEREEMFSRAGQSGHATMVSIETLVSIYADYPISNAYCAAWSTLIARPSLQARSNAASSPNAARARATAAAVRDRTSVEEDCPRSSCMCSAAPQSAAALAGARFDKAFPNPRNASQAFDWSPRFI